MPIYSFRCTNEQCEHHVNDFDVVFLSWNDDTTQEKCPKCNAPAKKVPALSARMKANWSQWNLLG